MRNFTQPEFDEDIYSPSPALGQAIATAVHQAVTDPYLLPMENLNRHLQEHPDQREIAVDLLAKWAPDNEMPTCFVWDAKQSGIQIDHPTSPWILEAVIERVKDGLTLDNPRGLPYINTFSIDGERFWLGFLRIPESSVDPDQMAGVFFSMDRYLDEHVPRFIGNLINRQRFPLVPFQKTGRALAGETDGYISLRILQKDGEVYFQSGRNFDPEKMIYSESKWYPKPIVCMQKGWNLQVFSAKVEPSAELSALRKQGYLLLVLTVILVTVFYWWGVYSRKDKKQEGGV